MNRRDVIRQAVLIVSLGANAALSEVAAGVWGGGGGYADVVSTVRAGCVATLWLAAYLLLAAAFCGRPVIKELPPLTMQTIWAHVYGLGLLTFVTVYCLLGVSSSCSAGYTVAVAGVSLEDILIRQSDGFTKRAALFLCTLLSTATVLLAAWASPDFKPFADAVDAGNVFVITCGGLLPLLSPFIYSVVRGPRHYTPGMVIEFVYFAAPFAVILSVVVLCTLSVITAPRPLPLLPPLEPLFVSQAEANWSRAYSANRSVETKVVERIILVTAADIAMPLLPLTMFPALCMAVQTALLYATVDFLSAAAVVAAGRHLCHRYAGEGSASFAWPLAAAALAFAARIYASFQAGGRGWELYKDGEKDKMLPPQRPGEDAEEEEEEDFDTAEV
jgi:hypothetical protein